VSLTAGGTYSSAPGLSIDGSTGAVDLALSTAGTYTVNYDIAATGGCAAFQTSASITITTAPSGTFSYATPYCSDGGTASPTGVALTAGGTYTSTPGLNINGASGDVDLALSTAGTYTVTYTIAAAGGCAEFTTTAPISITAAPKAGTNGTLNICINAMAVNLSSSLGGSPDMTGSWTFAGNPHNGTFVPGTDAAGLYTYTVNATSPCVGSVSATVNVTYNNTDTDGDGIIDCLDNCPNYPGLEGGTCDANPGPAFALGTIVGCSCQPIACSQTVTMELRTDSLSSQASWQILDQNTNLVICQFNIPINDITSPITESCCLPVGCYRLRVMDSGGDGFVSGSITGGYQLRESGPTGRRIIDNFGNFTNLAGGPPDVSAIANTYDNGAFCVPVGNDRPIFSSCDKQDWVANQYIVATENASVTAVFTASPINSVANTTSGYEFWFFDPNGTYSFRRFRNHATGDGYGTGATRACHFRLNSWVNSLSTPWLPNGVLLNVRIRGRVNGTNLAFGPACLFKMDAARAACPLVKLQDNPGNVADYSCGVSRVFGGANSGANKLVANPPQFTPALPDASTLRYQFRFRLPGEYPNAGSCIVRPIQQSPTLYMNWTTGDKLKCNTQYQVDLRVSKDGGATWCVANAEATCSANPTIWGKVCSVNITTSTYCPGPAQGEGSNLAAEGNGDFTMYPNPNRGDQLFLSLSKVEAGVHTVSVDIFDLTGKRAMARTIPVQDGFLKTNLDLNGDLATGMYMVNITAGEKTYTQRLVIQH
jgi:hypothetical protein